MVAEVTVMLSVALKRCFAVSNKTRLFTLRVQIFSVKS